MTCDDSFDLSHNFPLIASVAGASTLLFVPELNVVDINVFFVGIVIDRGRFSRLGGRGSLGLGLCGLGEFPSDYPIGLDLALGLLDGQRTGNFVVDLIRGVGTGGSAKVEVRSSVVTGVDQGLRPIAPSAVGSLAQSQGDMDQVVD